MSKTVSWPLTMKSSQPPFPVVSYGGKTKETVQMINAAAVEISKKSRLPLGCVHLAHPYIPGLGVRDAHVRAPLLLFAIDFQGRMFGVHTNEPSTVMDMAKNWGGSLLDNISTHLFQTSRNYQEFMLKGGAAMRTMSAKTAERLPYVQTSEENKEMIRTVLESDWQGGILVPTMPKGFEVIHDDIYPYTSGGCWFYAEALAQKTPGNHKTVALTLGVEKNTTMDGGYHACVKHPGNLYEDIWGLQTLEQMQNRLGAIIVSEDPMWDCLMRLNPSLNREVADERIKNARLVVDKNPIHHSSHRVARKDLLNATPRNPSGPMQVGVPLEEARALLARAAWHADRCFAAPEASRLACRSPCAP